MLLLDLDKSEIERVARREGKNIQRRRPETEDLLERERRNTLLLFVPNSTQMDQLLKDCLESVKGEIKGGEKDERQKKRERDVFHLPFCHLYSPVIQIYLPVEQLLCQS